MEMSRKETVHMLQIIVDASKSNGSYWICEGITLDTLENALRLLKGDE